MNIFYIITPLAAFVFALVLTPAIRAVAIRINLVDKPNARKVHTNPVPLVGGIAVFLSALLALLLAMTQSDFLIEHKTLLLGSFVLLVMGVIDDKIDLRASLKLVVQLLIAHFVYAQGIKIDSFFGVLGIYEIPEMAKYFLTIVVITGVVNAFNLMDGIDGLAAGLAITAFLAFAGLAFLTGMNGLAIIFIAFAGALIGFLRFNFSKSKKIFMGDAGSLALGFIIIVSAIMLLQASESTKYINLVIPGVIGILIVPVFDSLRVYRRRIKKGKSPFDADKTHFHHLVLQLGFKHKWATILIVFIVILIFIIGIISNSTLGITITLSTLLLLFIIFSSILQHNSNLSYWKTKLKEMEE